MTTSRPEILFPLFAKLSTLPGIGPKTEKNFEKLGVTRPRDLLFTLPHNCIDRRLRDTIYGITFPSIVTVEVEVGLHRPARQKGRPYQVLVRDSETEFQLVFFHARPDWVEKNLPVGQKRIVSGKIEIFDGIAQMVHPDHVLRINQAADMPAFEPVYPLSEGITQRTINKAAQGALKNTPDFREWIDPSLVKENGWPSWQNAVLGGHTPNGVQELSPRAASRERLAYDELLAHQITLALARAKIRKAKGIASIPTGELQSQVLSSLPYSPTKAQKRAVSEIQEDLASELRMNRLLQGDVGAGKTLVAFLAMLSIVECGGQATMMAPTEILARQHLSALQPLAQAAGVSLDILTGRDKGVARKKKTDALLGGEIDILVGTHALFSDDVTFNDLRLAVVDEQHRFGVSQRMSLGRKGRAVDILVMTATPIPRSLSLAQYGDMDISILDEKPPGRKPIDTVMISSGRLEETTTHLRNAIAEGRQAYWVCPLVDESEVLELTAAEARFKQLRAILGEGAVGLLHGQMSAQDKDTAMADFQDGRTKVLVATTVIEVGVDVPNASIMVIEQAERFGLAQLHQLRGRVGRGSAQSTCVLMYDAPLGETALARLSIMRETNDGFRIAERDLELRGAGDVLGVAQSGLPRFQIADLESQADLMKVAQDDARLFLNKDPDLSSERGNAVRTLLYLMEQDKAIRLLSVG